LYAALIVYVLLKWLFDQTSPWITREFSLSFIRFARLLGEDQLPMEWRVKISRVLQQVDNQQAWHRALKVQ
jgi:hypothetical protein